MHQLWRKYTAPDERVIATVTCGYADGYSRAFSGRASMLVRGQAAPVVGRVCMDQLMLDVTGIPDVQAGDEVIAAGGALPFDDLARIGGTIGYELVCGCPAGCRGYTSAGTRCSLWPIIWNKAAFGHQPAWPA